MDLIGKSGLPGPGVGPGGVGYGVGTGDGLAGGKGGNARCLDWTALFLNCFTGLLLLLEELSLACDVTGIDNMDVTSVIMMVFIFHALNPYVQN